MRVKVSGETWRRLVIAADEHRVDVGQQATICVAAALAAWRGGSRTAIPPEDGTPQGEAVLVVNFSEANHIAVAGCADARHVSPERLVALILVAAVVAFEPAPETVRLPLYQPRRWRTLRAADIPRVIPIAPALSITAAHMGDPSHGASIGVLRGGRTHSEDRNV